MVSKSATGMNASANLHFPQHRNAPQCLVRHPLLWDLRMVVLLGWVAISGIAGFGVANAQAPASPSYVSPPVTPLDVQVTPPPAALQSVIPDAGTPMVTIPEGEPLPTQPPHRETQSPIP